MNIISVAGIWDRGNCKRALVRLRLCESGSIKPDVRMLAQSRAKNLFNWIIIIISECCAGILGEVPRHAWSKDSARSMAGSSPMLRLADVVAENDSDSKLVLRRRSWLVVMFRCTV